MKRRTISRILSNKFDDWCSSITDDEVKSLVKRDAIFTGGCIPSMLMGDKLNDYDVYFATKETAKAVAEYYVSKFQEVEGNRKDIKVIEEDDGRIKIYIQSSGVAEDDGAVDTENDDGDTEQILQLNDMERPVGIHSKKGKDKYRPVYLSRNAITLSDKIQCIIRFYGNPDEIHANYDFVHCTAYWTSAEKIVNVSKDALEAMLTRELVYRGSRYPVASVIRTRKFIKRGWHVSAGQYLKMLFQISKLDISDVKVLEEQLTGVDASYFRMLIDAVNSEIEKNPDFKLESNYLVELIDKLYGTDADLSARQ